MFHVCFFLSITSFILFVIKPFDQPSSQVFVLYPYFNSNSQTWNFVRFLCCSLLSSSKESFAVVELEAHRSRCQSFEHPCLHEVVVDLKETSWCSLCCRLRLAGKYCVTAHARTQQSSASGQTTWTRLNITENNGNVQSHNICLAKVFDRDQTSLNLTKQDTTRLNTSEQGGQTY